MVLHELEVKPTIISNMVSLGIYGSSWIRS
jgi:hypothetical protein